MAFQFGQTINTDGNWEDSEEIQRLFALNNQKLGDWQYQEANPGTWVSDPLASQGGDGAGGYWDGATQALRFMDTPYGRVEQQKMGEQFASESGTLGAPDPNSWNTMLGIGRHANQHGSDGIRGRINDDGVMEGMTMDRESNRDMNTWLAIMAAAGVAGYAAPAMMGGGGVGTGAMSAGELAAMDAAGGALAGTGEIGAAAGAAGGGGAGAYTTAMQAGANGTAMNIPVSGGGGGFLSSLSGGGMDWMKLLGGVGSNIIGNNTQQGLNRAVQEANAQSIGAARESGQLSREQAFQSGQNLNNVSAEARNRMLGASERAAGMAQFTPFNVSGGLAGAQFGPNGATQTLDPRMRAIQDQNLNLSQGFLGSVNAGTPDQLAQKAYAGYNSWAAPQREQEVAGLQNRLAGQGLIGMRANSTGVNGQPIKINPQMTELMEGQERARLKNYEQSVLFGQQATNNQLAMGNQQLGQAVGIDKLGQEAIKLGQSLGDSQSAAGYRAGGFLTNGAQQAGNWDTATATQQGAWNNAAATQAGSWYNNAAQNAAQNLSGRRQDEAQADGARDRNIWNSIWGSVIGA